GRTRHVVGEEGLVAEGAPRGPVNRRAIGGLHGLCRFRQGPAAASTWLDPADPGLVRPRATFLSCLGEPGTVSPEPKHLSDRLSQVEASAVPPRVVTAGRGWDSVGVLEGRSAFGQLGHRLVEAVDDAVVYQAGEQGVASGSQLAEASGMLADPRPD